MAGVFNTVQYVLYGLLSLGVLVLIHELGHFVAARLTGIRVTAFSIGFGRGIFSFERKGTLYKIGWIPVGGYCRFAGEGEDLNTEDRKGEPDEFYERPAWARLITASAGVIFNFIFAFMIFYFLSLFGYSYKASDNRVVVLNKKIAPMAKSYPALSAGLRTGDRIISVNGVKTPNYRLVRTEILTRPDKLITVRVQRGDRKLTFRVHTGIRERGSGYIGIVDYSRFYFPVVVSSLLPGKPAQKAGLKKGDKIIGAGKVRVTSLIQFQRILRQNGARPIQLKIERAKKIVQLKITPYKYKKQFLVGFVPRGPVLKNYSHTSFGIFGSFKNAAVLFGNGFRKIFESIRLIFHKKVNTRKALAGPARIVKEMGTALKDYSAASFFSFLAMISLALGFFNILPIPAVDGGHVVLSLVEIIRRKRMSFQVLQRIQFVGVVLLMSLFAFVLIFDLSNLFG